MPNKTGWSRPYARAARFQARPPERGYGRFVPASVSRLALILLLAWPAVLQAQEADDMDPASIFLEAGQTEDAAKAPPWPQEDPFLPPPPGSVPLGSSPPPLTGLEIPTVDGRALNGADGDDPFGSPLPEGSGARRAIAPKAPAAPRTPSVSSPAVSSAVSPATPAAPAPQTPSAAPPASPLASRPLTPVAPAEPAVAEPVEPAPAEPKAALPPNLTNSASEEAKAQEDAQAASLRALFADFNSAASSAESLSAGAPAGAPAGAQASPAAASAPPPAQPGAAKPVTAGPVSAGPVSTRSTTAGSVEAGPGAFAPAGAPAKPAAEPAGPAISRAGDLLSREYYGQAKILPPLSPDKPAEPSALKDGDRPATDRPAPDRPAAGRPAQKAAQPRRSAAPQVRGSLTLVNETGNPQVGQIYGSVLSRLGYTVTTGPAGPVAGGPAPTAAPTAPGRTVIYYRPGDRARAQAVARNLPGRKELAESPAAGPDPVVVLR